ncbi:Rubrerythrin [Peptoclostridium litorale DSM 5388]|uniref:Rubrerythrin diiron-binding domain-containing protein n=1 Tax=Peptoclostridium litorale DSM 5388 TaxID=1121324 RepID=A0A069RIC6_PEPLI|nr:ferritin family protein [Peptoclostridium litorale]KDR96761.1 hypothetical protein CLIT_2c03670 [Peptoclostridium litorale DSM 5388]SIO34709.1 Rubrerythrin [Peptoclostridium litorale DSM 5388]
MESFKCLICGMNVNSSNIHINKNSFLNGNSFENLYCPFCGADSPYISSEGDIFIQIDESLDQVTLDVLDKAMKLEVFNGEFYSEASKLAKDENTKIMFDDLSNIEMMHARIHMKMGGFESLPTLTKPTYYEKLSSDVLLIKEAHSREIHAVAFYEKNMDSVCSPKIKEVFKVLSEVEKQHIYLTSE